MRTTHFPSSANIGSRSRVSASSFRENVSITDLRLVSPGGSQQEAPRGRCPPHLRPDSPLAAPWWQPPEDRQEEGRGARGPHSLNDPGHVPARLSSVYPLMRHVDQPGRHQGPFSSRGRSAPGCAATSWPGSLRPCGFLTKGSMLVPEMFSPLAIFAKGLNAVVKNRNNEGKQKLLTLSHEDRAGLPASSLAPDDK